MSPSAYDRYGRRKYLTRLEGERFQEKASETAISDAAFCLTLYYTGCRISEALNLTGRLSGFRKSNSNIPHVETAAQRGIIAASQSRFTCLNHSRRSAKIPNEKIWNFSRTTGWKIDQKNDE